MMTHVVPIRVRKSDYGTLNYSVDLRFQHVFLFCVKEKKLCQEINLKEQCLL